MSTPLVTYDDALQSLGDVPNLGDRPTATNIRNLCEDLCDKLEAIPSHQSNSYGFRGLVESTENYDLICPGTPWKVWDNPGNHRPTTVDVPAIAGGVITQRSLARKDAAVAYNAKRIVFEFVMPRGEASCRNHSPLFLLLLGNAPRTAAYRD